MLSSVQVNGGSRVVQKARQAGPGRGALVVRAGAERVTQSKKDIIVSPSILSANFAVLGEQVNLPRASAPCDCLQGAWAPQGAAPGL